MTSLRRAIFGPTARERREEAELRLALSILGFAQAVTVAALSRAEPEAAEPRRPSEPDPDLARDVERERGNEEPAR